MHKLVKIFMVLAVMITFGTPVAKAQSNNEEQIPPIQLWIFDCARWADKMMIFYAVQNNMDRDIESFTVYVDDYNGPNNSKAIYENGESSYMHWNQYLREDNSVPAHSRRIGAVMTEDKCPATAQTATIILAGRCSDSSMVTKQNPYGEYSVKYTDVPIREYMEANRDGVYCTNPNFKINVNQVRRDGDQVYVNFDITSTEDKDALFLFSGIQPGEAFLPDGKRCQVKISRDRLPLSKDTPVQVLATISGVPTDITEIKDLSIKIDSNQYDLYSAFKCVFKNLKIDS